LAILGVPRTQPSQSPSTVLSRKPTKEARELIALFKNKVTEVKSIRDIQAAATFLSLFLDTSTLEAFELIHHHAEGLLHDDEFTEIFQEWPGLNELKSFVTNKKWWKAKPANETRASPPPRKKIKVHRSKSVQSKSGPTSSVDTGDVDMSSQTPDEELCVTTTPGYAKQARKGTSVLRPRLSMTPAEPTASRQLIGSSFDSAEDLTLGEDDEIQLLEMPPGVPMMKQTSNQGTKVKVTRKRKFDVHRDDSVNRTQEGEAGEPFQFGRGRPPLSSVAVALLILSLI
jgi:hypothetical protein